MGNKKDIQGLNHRISLLERTIRYNNEAIKDLQEKKELIEKCLHQLECSHPIDHIIFTTKGNWETLVGIKQCNKCGKELKVYYFKKELIDAKIKHYKEYLKILKERKAKLIDKEA